MGFPFFYIPLNNMDYIKEAKQKYLKVREGINDDTKNLNEFFAFCYLWFRPNEYGKRIQKRLEQYFGLVKVNEKDEKGDSYLNFMDKLKLWFEIKVSYLGNGGTFTVRHIRKWQNFDYYLLCFINPLNDFKPIFVVVTCNDLINNFRCNYMNGTKESNEYNQRSSLGLSFKKDSADYNRLLRLNRLNGTDAINVFEFLSEQKYGLKVK